MSRSASPKRSLGALLRRGGLVRWLVVGAGIAALAGIAAVSYGAYHHSHEDDRVQRAADRLSTPEGWKLVDVQKEPGSPFFCIVSCPHAEVTKIFRTDIDPLEACAVIKAHVTREIAQPRSGRAGGGYCGWRAPLEAVGPQAGVAASANTAAAVKQLPSHFWPGGNAPMDDATYAYVTFIGGVT
jgi:hypothetical protein